jgi:hypothetical protein
MNEDIDAKRRALEAVFESAKDVEFVRKQPADSKTALIVEFREKIADLRMRGATWEKIAELLHPVIGCTKDTIRAAMKRPLAAKAKTTAQRGSVRKQQNSRGRADAEPQASAPAVHDGGQSDGHPGADAETSAVLQNEHKALTRKL